MSIPLDRLYHFIEDIAKEIVNGGILIYHFYPHGSKNINDFKELVPEYSWQEKILKLPILCHDQEPLNHDLYQNHVYNTDFIKILKSRSLYRDRNLTQPTIYNKSCLLHSEKRSLNLITYQENHQCVGVYYWCHAVIALDWFRFAEYVKQEKQVKKLFLIYNRAWSSTREYRLRFTDMLVQLSLQEHCQTTVNPIEPELGVHYDSHQFRNPAWRPQTVIENYFPISNAHSHYSADFDIKDYESTDIEVVLETLFDDDRLHLTEKSLRPIACGQPFILAGTHGSLEYLRSYGFKTFNDIWDESYDLIEDPQKRLHAITDVMIQIANLDPSDRERKIARAQIIAEYNKQRFFSKEFFNQVVSELTINLTTALGQIVADFDTTPFINGWERVLSHKEVCNCLESTIDDSKPTLTQVNAVLKIAKNLQKSKVNFFQ